MPETSNRQKNLLIVAIVVVLLGSVLFIIFSSSRTANKSDKNTGKTEVYNDPVSGKKIINQEGKVPESQTTGSNTAIFAGFDALLNRGLTLQQVQKVYDSLGSYPTFTKEKTQISLAVNSIQSVPPQDSDPEYRWSIQSHIVVNKKDTYQLKVYYSGVASAQILLYNESGSELLLDSSASGE